MQLSVWAENLESSSPVNRKEAAEEEFDAVESAEEELELSSLLKPCTLKEARRRQMYLQVQ